MIAELELEERLYHSLTAWILKKGATSKQSGRIMEKNENSGADLNI